MIDPDLKSTVTLTLRPCIRPRPPALHPPGKGPPSRALSRQVNARVQRPRIPELPAFLRYLPAPCPRSLRAAPPAQVRGTCLSPR